MERISTGNRELDRIVGGGLPRNTITVVMGGPGSGKTTLAEQLVFANASPDRPALYLTTLSEPLAKVVTYLQSYQFADVARIGSQIHYASLSEALLSAPDRLYDEVLALIQRHRPGVIVIDSFKAIGDLFPDLQQWRRAVFNLAGLLTAYGTTSLWVGEYTWDILSGPLEFAVADAIIELSREQSGTRDDRFLRVAKLRGSDFLDGTHALRISAAGLEIFPRLVSPQHHSTYQPMSERLHSGITGLDQMIDTGWLRGTSTLVTGPSGSGKTMLALHFLREGVRNGEPGLIVNFQENPTQLRRVLTQLGWPADDLLVPGKLDQLYSSPVELQIDTIVQEIFRRIELNGVRRVVIDALGEIEQSARDYARYREYVYALTQYFASRNVTAMLTLELARAKEIVPSRADMSPMSDNLVLLSMKEDRELVRTVRILKTRGSAHDGRERVLQISSQGMAVE